MLSLGSDIFSRTDLFDLKGLKSTVLDKAEEAVMVVNSKNETAEESISKHLKKVTNKDKIQMRNLRMDHKREQYKEKITQLLNTVDTWGELNAII